ncbi:MAG: fused MFS/spermidine synthase [Hyphomicrobiales bacterium]
MSDAMPSITPPQPDRNAQTGMPGRSNALLALVYVNAFVSGAVIMSFEMLGSRYLNPYFGSGIYTWAALISSVLAALAIGYFIGGWLGDRRPSPALLGACIIAASFYLMAVPAIAEAAFVPIFDAIADARLGAMAAAMLILFVPLMVLGFYSPFAIRLVLVDPHNSGRVSGRIYGISTLGSIFGVLFTTFYLVPSFGTRSNTIGIAACAFLAGLSFVLSGRKKARLQ